MTVRLRIASLSHPGQHSLLSKKLSATRFGAQSVIAIARISMVVFCLAGAVACDSSTPGTNDLIDFSPLDCGRIGCSFDAPIATGSRLSLHISAPGLKVRRLEVRSSDNQRLTVTPIVDIAGRPTWELHALAAGEVTLEVFRPSSAGDEESTIDQLTINVDDLTDLRLVHFLGSASGPNQADGFDESWTVVANRPVSFRVTPFDNADNAMLGRFDYVVNLAPELTSGLIDSQVDEGRLYLRAPHGKFAAMWTDNVGRTLRVQITSE